MAERSEMVEVSRFTDSASHNNSNNSNSNSNYMASSFWRRTPARTPGYIVPFGNDPTRSSLNSNNSQSGSGSLGVGLLFPPSPELPISQKQSTAGTASQSLSSLSSASTQPKAASNTAAAGISQSPRIMQGFGSSFNTGKGSSNPPSPGLVAQLGSMLSSKKSSGAIGSQSKSVNSITSAWEVIDDYPTLDAYPRQQSSTKQSTATSAVTSPALTAQDTSRTSSQRGNISYQQQPPQQPSQSTQAAATATATAAISPAPVASNSTTGGIGSGAAHSRFVRFSDILASPNVNLEQLRTLSWGGIPDQLRAQTWQVLMGYLPTNANRREATLVRKRREYEECVSTTFSRGESLLDQTLWHQIQIDVPRTCPDSPLFQDDQIQQSIAKLLYCWADRHPASGYVQGINDLVTPFYMVFLTALGIDCEAWPRDQAITFDNVAISIGGSTSNGKVKSVRRRDRIPEDILAQVEADSFWCLSKLLDGIQDNYIHAQPGIHRQIQRLSDLITRIDTPLATHLSQEGIDFIQFAFRWVNCLLMREMSLPCTVRMWDTYLSEDGGTGFSDFHVYVCAAFLVKWSEKIRKMDFQEIMLFLQNIPTDKWTAKDIEVLLAEAYMWKSLFQDSKAHLNK